MKQYLLLIVCISIASFLWGQNLVTNPSFETTSACPLGPGQFNLATGWTDANASADSCSSPDLIAGCSWQIGGVNSPNMLMGYQPSRTGTHHAGLILYEAFPLFTTCIPDDYREYIGGQLSAPMTAGQSYCVSFYINKANDAQWAVDKIGVLFSNTPVNYAFPCPGGGVMAGTPQLTYTGPALTDTLNWVLVEWTYVATGGEQYFAIGNFASTASTQASAVGTCGFAIHPYAYYFIDDVSVVAGACCNLNITGVTNNVSCGASNDGSIDITVTNGIAPLTYLWSNAATTEDLTGLTAGAYSVTVTDSAGCSATYSTTVSSSNGLSVSGIVTDINCGGSNNGAIDITPASGAAPFSYIWSNAATTEDLNGLAAGPYSVTVTDAGGCTATYSATVTSTPGLSITTNNTDISCNGANDGTATVIANGGTLPYSYSWSSGATTAALTGLAAGTYVVTVTDNGGAPPTLDTLYAEGFQGTHNWNLTVTTGANSATPQIWAVNDSEGGVAPPGCGVGGNGDRTLHITCTSLFCGTFITGAVYNATQQTNKRAESPAFSTLGYTNITLGFTYIANGDGLLDNASLLYNAGSGWVVLDPSLKSVVCGSGQGQWTAYSVTLPAICENNPSVQLAFNWTNNGDNIGTDPSIAVNNIVVTSMGGGSGSVCSGTQSVTITEPSAITATNTTISSACGAPNGSVDLSVSGGTSGYTYLWSNAATSQDISALTAGSYTVTVYDANNCTVTNTANVANSGTAVTVSASTVSSSCGSPTGTIDLSVNTGTAPYTYLWSNGATTQDLTGLAGGSYTVTTTGTGGCSDVSTFVVGSGSATTIALDTVIHVACNGESSGEIQITPSGNSTCSSSSLHINELLTDVLGGLSSGDGSGCGNATNPLSAEFIELIGPPGANIGCHVLTDGDWTITIPPGTVIPADGIFTIGNNNTPLHIGNGTVFDLDVNSCQCFTDSCQLMIFTNGGEYLALFDGTGAFIEGLMYGTPSTGNTPPMGANTTGGVISTAGLSGCVSSVTIPGPAAFITVGSTLEGTTYSRSPDGSGGFAVDSTATPNACNTAGAPNFVFTWSNGATTEDISGLMAGTYTVTVSDGGGCDAIQSFTVTEPSAITVTTDAINDATCLVAGSVSISVAGGTGAYSYLWSNGATTEDISGLSAGTYNVTVTDANGCQMPGASYTVNSVGVPTITVNSTTNPTCFAGTNGSIDVIATSGTPAYTYAWSNGQTSVTATGLGAGVYGVTVTDNTGCTVSQTITVTEPAQLVATVTTVNATCVNNDATAAPNVSGGTGAYSYQWSTGETTQNLSNLPGPGNVSVTVTDANGCSVSSLNNAIGLDTTLTLSASSSNLDCSGDSTGTISLTAANGGLPYSYLWSNGASSDSLSGLGAATYSVTVTDASGCSISDSYVITLPLLPTVSAFIGQVGILDSTIIIGESININAGNDQTGQGVTYQWSSNPSDANFGNATNPATTVSPGTEGAYSFMVIATSVDGCMDTSSVNLTVEGLDDPQIPTAFTPNNDDLNEVFRVVNLDPTDIIEFKVFNRWGQVVFDNANGSGEWDGTLGGIAQPRDVYMYIISYQRSIDAEPIVIRGNITLLR